MQFRFRKGDPGSETDGVKRVPQLSGTAGGSFSLLGSISLVLHLQHSPDHNPSVSFHSCSTHISIVRYIQQYVERIIVRCFVVIRCSEPAWQALGGLRGDIIASPALLCTKEPAAGNSPPPASWSPHTSLIPPASQPSPHLHLRLVCHTPTPPSLCASFRRCGWAFVHRLTIDDD